MREKPVVSIVHRKVSDRPPVEQVTRIDHGEVEVIKGMIKEAIDLAVGGLDKLVSPGDIVLIKPNLAFKAPPDSFAVVDPRVIEAICRLIKEEAKCKELWVGDNPSLGPYVGIAREAFKESGMEEAAYRGGADKVIYFDETATVEVDIPNGMVFRKAKIFKPIFDADVIINLPKMKVHLAGVVTLGLKNWNGIIPYEHPSGQQQGAHRIDLGYKFADLYRAVKPNLTLVDGIIGMEGQGPHAGEPVVMNLIIAGKDTVAVDAVTSAIMGFDPFEIPSIRCAHTYRLGVADLREIEVKGARIEDVRRFFKRATSDPTGLFEKIHVWVQQTCPGCYCNIRGALDLFRKEEGLYEKLIERYGEVNIIAGGVPDLDVDRMKPSPLFVVGDCWKLFPSKKLVEKAIEKATKVIYYPGCAPVYIFSQLYADLVKLAEE